MQRNIPEIDATVLARMQRMDMMMSMMRVGSSGRCGSHVDCYRRAFALWRFLTTRSSLENLGLTFESPPDSFCFRIRFPGNCLVYELSISVPTDAMGNRGDSQSGFPETLETALFDCNDDLIYNEELGYGDICRFSSNEEVEIEILRLSAFRV